MAGRNSIGVMDQRVTFQTELVADDGQGGQTSTGWQDIAATPSMWAQVMQPRGAEGEQETLRQTNRYEIEIKIRNRDDLHERMAVVWRGRRYNIRSIPPSNFRSEFLTIHAENGVPL